MPQPYGPDDHPVGPGGGSDNQQLWATPDGLEGRLNLPTDPPTYIRLFVVPWEEVDRISADMAAGTWSPPYGVRLGPSSPGDEPGWTRDIEGGPLKPE
jgi:hypothetical protein